VHSLTWDKYFMGLVQEVSKKGSCLRAQVGVVIAKDNVIISTGYNGAPTGMPHCYDIGCLMVNNHCVRSLHAEENALLFAGRERTIGTTLYTTHMPCYHCCLMIINMKIVRVVYGTQYGNTDGIELLKLAGIEVKEMK